MLSFRCVSGSVAPRHIPLAAMILFIETGSVHAQAAPSAARSPGATYMNPILFGDWSDPDAIRVGDDFYLTASSFVNVPGLPILHSRDLIHWTILGHALPRLLQDDHYRTPRKGGGVWAPAIRYRNGEFRIYYPDPDYGIFVVTARDPRGPWSEPRLVDGSKGAIDPAPFWDEDGQGWLLHGWAKSRAGISNRLTLKRLDASGLRTTDAGVTVVDGDTLPPVETSVGRLPWRTLEGPKLYRRDGWYYIFAPAGGVKPGWQAVFRSRAITGPYEARNVMDQGDTPINGPHQGAWIDTGLGEDWFIHFQDTDSYGRRTHLQPMTWKDGWPVIGTDSDRDGRGAPVLCHVAPRTRRQSTGTPQASDAFDGGRLSPAWQWNSNPGRAWADLTARPGWLRLPAISMPANLYEAGALLTQKLPAPAFTATVVLDFAPLTTGQIAGLGMFGDTYAWIGLERRADGNYLVRKVRSKDADSGAEQASTLAKASGPVMLRLTARPVEQTINGPSSHAPWRSRTTAVHAEVRFAYSVDGRTFVPVPGAFVSTPGRWVGAQMGLFSIAPTGTPSFAATRNGHADFDDFRVTIDQPDSAKTCTPAG